MLASSSPECFVGRHVLLRLYVPRYPPLALSRLTYFFGLILCLLLYNNLCFHLIIVFTYFLVVVLYAVFKVRY